MFPLTLELDPNKWTKSIKVQLVEPTEKLCAAKATLYSDSTIDFYFYDGQNCYLGDFEVQDENNGITSTLTSLKFHRSNPIDYINSIFTINFFASEEIWTPLIYDSSDVQSSESTLIECGILCEISSCDFFVHSPEKCYFGDWELTGGSAFTTGKSDLQTYHKSALKEYLNKDFKSDPATTFWTNWTYKIENGFEFQQCRFICLFEEQCDFVSHQGSQCAFGNFTYSGPPVTTNTATRNAFIKKHTMKTGFPEKTFVTLVGDTSQTNGPISYKYWPSHIYSTRTNTAGEHRCAQFCLLVEPKTCSFYYHERTDTNYVCYFGSFTQDVSQDDHPLNIDETTEYKLRKDISKF